MLIINIIVPAVKLFCFVYIGLQPVSFFLNFV